MGGIRQNQLHPPLNRDYLMNTWGDYFLISFGWKRSECTQFECNRRYQLITHPLTWIF